MTYLQLACYNFTPSVWEEDDKFVFCNSCGGMYCLKISTGEPIWVREVDEVDLGGFSRSHCVAGPGDAVYNVWNKRGPDVWNKGNGNGGKIRAYDAATGTVRWERETDLECHVEPVVVGFTGAGILVVPLGSPPSCPPDNRDWPEKCAGDAFESSICGLDAASGSELWRIDMPVWESFTCAGSTENDYFFGGPFSSPSVNGDGIVYTCHQSGVVYAIDGISGRILSQFDTGVASSSAAVLIPGTLLLLTALKVVVFRDEKLEAEWLKGAKEAADRRADPRLWEPGESLGQSDKDAIATSLRILPQDMSKWQRLAFFKQEPAMTPETYRQLRDKEKEEAEETALKFWIVIGGDDRGGIVVRSEHRLGSTFLGRLACGAKVREIETEGERLHYAKVNGLGPDTGWVSLTLRGTDLLRRVA
eukprot:gnl/TRDRNA2_/TRDRNA2_169814_c0_seq1.p1 gnl/TRDRNA2_/TRDRNA2_169814_c0~~gnl/TRDRNA2_/TRDRNA2_169814_c0_seq1.p1  ORF type:complete len:418 (-),score=61.00 gnl/TRDRNA2_/TRDRNA2_169814_c0_seq1:48-1301(-)